MGESNERRPPARWYVVVRGSKKSTPVGGISGVGTWDLRFGRGGVSG